MASAGKKVLVLGGGGVMGSYLCPRLSEMGYEVDAVSLELIEKTYPRVRYIQGNAFELLARREILQNHYDAIVDFMTYPGAKLSTYLPLLLEQSAHYIFLSSYRVYDNKETPITENSPRLLDSSEDALLRNSDDYSIYKAHAENIIRAHKSKNWTIVRPGITYSLLRYQLVVNEAADTVGRAFAGKKLILPAEAYDVQGSMSRGKDVAEMIARLVLNERAYAETYNVVSNEHHSWGEIAAYYKEICGLECLWLEKKEYYDLFDLNNIFRIHDRWKLEYDRLFDRVMDNSKILAHTGLKQSDLTALYDGLEYEIKCCPRDYPFKSNPIMDAYLEKI